jgi:hypothetical protein
VERRGGGLLLAGQAQAECKNSSMCSSWLRSMLQVRNGYANIVWSCTPDMAAALTKLSPTHFAAAVNEVSP